VLVTSAGAADGFTEAWGGNVYERVVVSWSTTLVVIYGPLAWAIAKINIQVCYDCPS
jgi:hypothetical protein